VLKLFKQSTEQNKNHDTVMNLTYDDPCIAFSLYDGNRRTASASQKKQLKRQPNCSRNTSMTLGTTLAQTTSRWSPLLDGAECAEESTDAAVLQEQQSQCPKLIVLRIVQYE
jgi:hypothetical protein